MADEKQAAPEPPGAPQGGVTDDDLIEVKVAGDTRKVPLRDVRAAYQMRERADQLLERARQETETDRMAFQVGRNLTNLLASDPDEAVRQVQRIAAQQGWRPRQPDPDAQSADDDADEPGSNQIRNELASLRAELRAMRGERSEERMAQQVRSQIERFPIARQSEDARTVMELVLTAAAAQEPQRPLSDLADTVHTHLVNLASAKAEEREQRKTESRKATQTIESAGGSPPIQTPAEITRKTNVLQIALETLRKKGLENKLGT